jgi:hypothetical protein
MSSFFKVWITSLMADCVGVLAFVGIGRAVHQKGDSLAGIASTAWPFLAGLAIGWILWQSWSAPLGPWRTGVPVALVTVAVGMLLRVWAGQGTAWAFIGVAVGFLGAVMVGWRLLAVMFLHYKRQVLASNESSGETKQGG